VPGNQEHVSSAPEPHEIYARTRKEGERRLSRPRLELASTAFLAGVDVAFGITALGIVHALVAERAGEGLATLAGAVAFGIAFVSIVIGRSELFTENFLVPIAGLDPGDRRSWLKLLELWAVSPVLNLAAGMLVLLIVTSHGVLPEGTGQALVGVARGLDDNSLGTAFLSAVAAGAVITMMTWLIEGAGTPGVRLAVAWIGGALLALGAFNHAIVVTLELFAGIRYGADVGGGDLVGNLGVAVVGNMLGGILFVTLTRLSQAKASARP
jgi:formate-nitrite transporter family protein